MLRHTVNGQRVVKQLQVGFDGVDGRRESTESGRGRRLDWRLGDV